MAGRHGLAHHAKRAIQRGVQRVHHHAFDRGLPHKLGLYFHPLEPEHYPAFEQAVGEVRALGYRFVDTPEAFLRASQPVAWVSFDDNYKSWYTARPLLDALDVRATFYVTTGVFRDEATDEEIETFFERIAHDGERLTLSTGELQALAADGHTIGAHTVTHPVLSRIEPAAARRQMAGGKAHLERILDAEICHFAYPYGLRRYFTPRLMADAQAMGFTTIARAIPAFQHAPQGPVELHRSGWRFDRSAAENLRDLRVDGRLFERATGRSAIG